jgi:hypothetical protein
MLAHEKGACGQYDEVSIASQDVSYGLCDEDVLWSIVGFRLCDYMMRVLGEEMGRGGCKCSVIKKI